MAKPFDDRIAQTWASEQWLFGEIFNEGMSFIEGYIPSVALGCLNTGVERLAKLTAEIDCSHSTWSDESTAEEWNRCYTPHQYRQMFFSGKIVLLHIDYTTLCAGYDLIFKLMIEPVGNVEVIVYRDNFLPREESHDRFYAVCHHLKYLQELFAGPALFLGPDTLNYPEWPDKVPQEWYRLN